MDRKTLFLAASQIALAHGEVRVSEFLASNGSILVPGQAGSEFHDWIELENTGDSAVDLSNWGLTDNPESLDKWVFPAGTSIAANSFLVVLANHGATPDENGVLRTNFALSASGEYVGLSDPDGTVISGFGPDGTNYPAQTRDVSYGLSPADGSPVFFANPTPGAPNSGGFVITSDVEFSAGRGYHTAPLSVTLSTGDPGATIHYTLDGRTPLNGGGSPADHATSYSGPVAIPTTTVLRAVAARPGAVASAIGTHSYIFPADVATQVRPGDYPASWGGEPNADYEVDPDVSLSATDAQRFLDGLRDLPTISVSTDKEDLFGSGGLYSNTQSSDERLVSAEYFDPLESGDGQNGPVLFQIDCGMRIQGGASRNPNRAIKHSMSLRFRAEYGASSLDAAVFPEPAAGKFNALHLRANYNNSWIHFDSNQRRRTNHFTDQWMRDSHIAMGNDDGGSGRYIHLFLNGLYWGVYNLHERPENDHYANYSGGRYEKNEVFGLNPGNSTSEERASFQEMKDAIADGNWQEITDRLDVDNYIDYYIIQHFGHNDDLKPGDNWRAAGGGSAGAPWRFYSWDSERSLENPGNTSPLNISQDGAGIFGDLAQLPEFRMRFADRVYRHLFNDGALTNDRNRRRTLARIDELDRAVVGESARWGDDRSGGAGPDGDYTRAENWLPALFGPLGTSPSGGLVGPGGWFPENGINRTDRMIWKWKSDTWSGTSATMLPDENPPTFLVGGMPQYGGTIPVGQQLTLAGDTGQIFFTTDGSDPREPGGAVRPGLSAYLEGAIVPVREGVVKARWKNGEQWSALAEASFVTGRMAAPGDIIVSELHYHPLDPDASEIAAASELPGAPVLEDQDFQFLELLNVGNETVNLDGCRLSIGVTFTFPPYQLAPGQRLIVVENTEAFGLRFPSAVSPVGQWSGALAKSGEVVSLLDSTDAPLETFAYDEKSPWPETPDGEGDSLNRLGTESDSHLAVSWAAAPPTPGDGLILDRFASWAQLNGLSGPDDDSDNDGIPAIIEYGLLLDPAAGNSLPAVEMIDGSRVLSLARDPGRGDVTVNILGSEDLDDWTLIEGEILTVTPNREEITVTAPAGASRYFFQVEVSNP